MSSGAFTGLAVGLIVGTLCGLVAGRRWERSAYAYGHARRWMGEAYGYGGRAAGALALVVGLLGGAGWLLWTQL